MGSTARRLDLAWFLQVRFGVRGQVRRKSGRDLVRIPAEVVLALEQCCVGCGRGPRDERGEEDGDKSNGRETGHDQSMAHMQRPRNRGPESCSAAGSGSGHRTPGTSCSDLSPGGGSKRSASTYCEYFTCERPNFRIYPLKRRAFHCAYVPRSAQSSWRQHRLSRHWGSLSGCDDTAILWRCRLPDSRSTWRIGHGEFNTFVKVFHHLG